MIAAALSVAPPPEGEVFDFAAVRDRVREMRGTLPAGETVEVVFSPGVYRIADTLALYKADGHAVYRASEKGRVRFTGGVAVPQGAFRDARVNGVRARVADVAPLLPAELPPWPKEFRAPPAPWLYRNGRPLEIARWPNGEEWMQVLHPQITVASAGKNNRYGHPSVEACDRIRASGSTFYCTTEYGRIRVRIVDGKLVCDGYVTAP